MPPVYDITFKELFGRDARPLLSLLLPDAVGGLEVIELSTELPATLRRVDLLGRCVCRVRPGGPVRERLLAIEWQIDRDPKLPATMLLRGALAYHHHGVLVTTILLAATPAALSIAPTVLWSEGDAGDATHDVITIPLYERSAVDALASSCPELWALAAVMHPVDGDRVGLVASILDRIAQAPDLTEERRTVLSNCTASLACLSLSPDEIGQIAEAVSRRSQIMFDLKNTPFAKYMEDEGRRKGTAASILTILASRHVNVPDGTRQKILGCTDLDTLNQWLILAVEGRDAELRAQADASKGKAA